MIVRPAEELEVVRDHLQLRAILTTLFVLPGLKLKTPFHQNAAAFLEVLDRIFGIAAPESDIHEGHVLLLLAAFILPDPIQGKAHLGDRVAGLGFPELKIASQIADKGNTIVTAHKDS